MRLRTSLHIISATLGIVASSAPVHLAAQTPLPPTLVVQITVDQLRPDYLDRFASQLTGGLGRLLRQGAFFTNATHDHATTETAPGHATLWSGRFPSHTGVVLNEIGVADPQMPLLFGRGGGASPYRFRGSSYFDWVRSRDQFSRALSVSRKDRGAILPLGRARQSVFWYSLDGRFTTSRYYGDTIPTWVQRFNALNFTAKYLGAEWTTLLDASMYPERDSVSFENQGKDFVFPHRLAADQRTGTNDFVEFPWMDDVTVNFALAGVNALELGKGPTLDVLAVSLSTTDAVGHRYGPDSRELHDQVLRVDRALGRLIDSLYKLRDSTRIVFALGADHGVAPFPESHFDGADPDRGRVDPRPVIDAARSALAARGVEGDALLLQSGIVSLDRARLQAKGISSDSVVTALRNALLKLPGMQRVDRVRTLAAAAARGDRIGRRWLHSIPPDLMAELTVTLQPFYYWFTTRYATHGTPHDYDARIPILFMGPMFRPGRYTTPVRSVDIAPTIAAVTDVTPIEPVDGRVLTEALRDRAAPRTVPPKR
ncbi:MAG: alkaline phosphatase family protein [Gemmatimonadaceae bacterium]|nr:alkaline phosphatase family protein [Gemmatimonadaceae bacterium]